MAGRHQAQYARYGSSGQGGSNNNLSVPYPPQNSGTPTMTSPYSSSSSPGHHSPNAKQAHPTLKKYTLQPPLRQPPLHKTMPAMGFAGMFPQRPNQDEDILTEDNVRNGFIDRPVISNEHTCAHDMVYSKLQDDQQLLTDLGTFMVDVLKRKKTAARISGPPSFKAPIRSTLMDAKKEKWLQDLAGGVEPLRNMMRNVPHGFKGEKLLDTLAAKQVPFLRATWFIKIVGLSEMSQRNASNATTPVSQTYQWTQVVYQHLKRQLTELAHASTANSSSSNAPMSGSSPALITPSSRAYKTNPGGPGHHDNASKPWVSPESRARFEHRWSYSTRLARWQYCEGLLDQRTFLKWTLDSLAGSSSFEIMWLILGGIIQDYIGEYKRNRTLMKLLIETLIKAYNAVSQCIAQGQDEAHGYRVHHGLRRDIGHLLQSLFLSTPDMFVIPKLYYQYQTLFETILGQSGQEMALRNTPDLCHVMDSYWSIIKRRNEIFCGTLEENQITSEEKVGEKRRLDEGEGDDEADEGWVVLLLDAVGRSIDSGSIFLDMEGWVDGRGHSAPSLSRKVFGTDHLSASSFTSLVGVLCRWATSENRHGDWRTYLLSSLLLHWRDQDTPSERRHMLQDALMRFLDDQVAGDEANETDQYLDDTEAPKNENDMEHVIYSGDVPTDRSILFLFDTLIRLDLFSYQKYLLRLIARGDLERVWRCLHYLRSFPLPTSAPAYLVHQRCIAVHNSRLGQKVEEEKALERLKGMAKLAIDGSVEPISDGLFGKDAVDRTEPLRGDTIQSFELALSDKAEQELALAIESSTRYTILKFTRDWLIKEVKRYAVKNVQIGEDNWRTMTSPGACLLNAQQYMAIVRILHSAKDYQSMIDVALWVLEKINERQIHIFPLVVDTLRRYAKIWKLLNCGERVAQCIWAKHRSLASRGQRERCLMMYMVQLVQEGYALDDTMRTQLQQDLQVKQKISGRSAPPLVDDIGQLVEDPSDATVEAVAESLCGRYQYTAGWVGSVLDTSVDVLREAAKVKQPLEFQQLATAVANLLQHVGNQMTLTGQLDEAILEWLAQQCSPACSTPVVEDMGKPFAWLPLLLTLLVARNLVSLDSFLTRFALPWFERIAVEIQQMGEVSWAEPVENTSIQTCKNMVVLIRLMIVQDRSRPVSTGDVQPSDMTARPWQLRNEELFRLEVRRESQLGSSLTRIEPMFVLMEKLVLVASHLPLSSSLLQDLVWLQTALPKMTWFRQACVRDLNGVYQRFAREAEGSTEKMIRRKMLYIVDELIGGHLCYETPPQTPALVHENGPEFIEKLQRIFFHVNQWNEEQCRVQISLLLDNILLSEDERTSLHGVADMMDTSPAPLASLQSSDEVPLPTGTTIANGDDSFSNDSTKNKDLEAFVNFFFGMVLSDEDTKSPQHSQFFQKLLRGLREPVLLALLNHGVRLLEGQPGTAFPVNVLVMPPTTLFNPTVFDTNQYGRQSRAFLHILQYMMSECAWKSEQKLSLLKTLFDQIRRFKDAGAYYRVMQSAHACYADAARALQMTNYHVDDAIALYATEGLPEDSGMSEMPRVTMEDIRTSLVIRLRLVVPFVSLIWEHPKEDECNILEWIRVLVSLLGNPIVHGNGSQERLFEFMLDLVSMLIDEVPQKLRKASLSQLSAMHSELSLVPPMFQSRVKRILPFLTHNVYLSNTRLASALLRVSGTNDAQKQQQHMESCMDQAKPWEWLEDYMSDRPHENDVPISLGLFHARRAKREESTYVRWFKFGFDDGLPVDVDAMPVRVATIGTSTSRRRPQPSSSTSPSTNEGVDANTTETSAADEQGPPKRRRIEMEEGEIP